MDSQRRPLSRSLWRLPGLLVARRNPVRINAAGRQVNARRVFASTPARTLPRAAKQRVAEVLRSKLGNRFGRNANVEVSFSPGVRAALSRPRTPSRANAPPRVAPRAPQARSPVREYSALPNGEAYGASRAVRVRGTPSAVFAVPGGRAANDRAPTLQKLNLPLCAPDLLAAIRGQRSVDFLTGAPGSCFYDSLKAKVAPLLARKGWLCDLDRASPRLGPHQVVHVEIAKLMAAAVKTPWAINNRRGLLVWANTGSGKCFARGTAILMADGSVKAVEDVAIGDAVMGDDGTRRAVLTLGRGSEEMYRIVPSKEGEEPFGCNASHVLVLKHALHRTVSRNRRGKFVARFLDRSSAAEPTRLRYPSFESREAALAFLDTVPADDTVHLSVRALLDLPPTQRRSLRQYRVGVEAFEFSEAPLFDPYVIGAWLGDGLPSRSRITNVDQGVLDSVRDRVARRGLSLATLDAGAVRGLPGNAFTDSLKAYGIFATKRIPHALKTGSRATRLAVLAGLLDTDGHLHHNCFEIGQASEGLARDIVFVARSLGFGATLALSPAGKMWRATIFGEGLEAIPTVLASKRASPRRQVKDARVFGFEVVPLGVGDYYGFTVDGNHRFLLGDFTVTHNTVSALGILLSFWHTSKNLVIATTPANKQDNNLAKYALNLLDFFPLHAPLVLGAGMPSPAVMKNSADLKAWATSTGGPALARRISVLSYHEFGGVSQRYDLDGGFLRHYDRAGNERGSVVIMDEAQNLFLPKLGGQNRAFEKAKRYLIDPANFEHIHAFALTATPANTASEWLQLLNMLRPAGSASAFTLRDFAAAPHKFRGLISYADIRGDRGHFGSIESAGNNGRLEIGARNLRVEMTPQYYAAFLMAYLDSRGKEVRSIGGSATNAQKFFEASRAAGCALIKGAYGKIFSEAQLRELRRAAPGEIVPSVVPVDNGEVLLSEKMKLLVKNLVGMRGCQYVYCPESNNNRVLKALVSALARVSGTAAAFSRVKSGDLAAALQSPRDHRYVVYSNGVISGYGETDAGRESILRAFRDRRNSDGSRIKILIGNVYEGLDLAFLRGVHIVSPLSVKSSDDQAVGRALRYCGHLSGESSVAVFRYLSVEPRGHALAVKRGKGAEALRKKLEGARAELRRLSSGNTSDETAVSELANTGNETSHLVASPSGSPADQPNAAVNSFVYDSAKRRYAPQAALESCLKGESIECGILSGIQFGRVPRCGKCNVQIGANGNLASLNAPSPSPSVAAAGAGGGIRGRLRGVLTSYRRRGGWGQRLSPTRQRVHGAVRRVAGSPFGTPRATAAATANRAKNNNNNNNVMNVNTSSPSPSLSPSPSPRPRKQRR